MNISGMDLNQVSQRLIPCLLEYFGGNAVLADCESIFAESYLFDFDEIKHIIPKEYHSQFKADDRLNGASGFLEFQTVSKPFTDKEFTALLVADASYSRAFFFAVEETDSETGETKITTLADFLKGGNADNGS